MIDVAEPLGAAGLRAEVEALLDDAGYELGDLATLTFGDVDSLAVAELVLLVEAEVGHVLALEAFDLGTPLRDLLVLAHGDRAGSWA